MTQRVYNFSAGPAAMPVPVLESIQRDMVAVRVSRDHRLAVVGSPDYFASRPKPSSPHDLPTHRCINLRGGSSGPYRWEFEKDGEALVVDVSGPLIVDDADLMIRARANSRRHRWSGSDVFL